ncbi:hypothetical protein MTO96_028200 [Rhipicephalus appendiculatus]
MVAAWFGREKQHHGVAQPGAQITTAGSRSARVECTRREITPQTERGRIKALLSFSSNLNADRAAPTYMRTHRYVFPSEK